jgi:hypothetical protein
MATLAEMKAKGEGLMANCRGPNCGRGRLLPMDLLIERYGPDYEVIGDTRIAAACKCDRCGHRGAQVNLQANTSPNAYASAKGG